MSEKSDETRRRLIATPLGLLNRPPLPHELIQQEQQAQTQPQGEEEEPQAQPSVEEAFRQGYLKAQEDLAIHVPCVSCGESIPLSPKGEELEIIKSALQKKGWRHEYCSRYRSKPLGV